MADHLREWIGRSETAADVITERLVAAFQATFGGEPLRRDDPAPLAIHWCLAPHMAATNRLGSDGHPERGDFLPPVPLPRRMWAGGETRFHDHLRVGDEVNRVSRIADVAVKTGRSGMLCFVTVENEFFTARGRVISERQDIVYREALGGSEPGAVAARPDGKPNQHQPAWRELVTADAVLLFRYSALTFNGHRIHYDHDYAMRVEDYPGLVVHGPLQATLLLHLAARIRNGLGPPIFTYRAITPLFEGGGISLNARKSPDGLDLWVADAFSQHTMMATAPYHA